MPTGYTAKLMEKGETFQEFVMRCARAMGACVMMRDDPLDAPIPKTFKPSTHHLSQIKAARKKLKELSGMNERQQLAYGRRIQEANLKMWGSSDSENNAQNARIEAMEAQIKAWEPPTKEHIGFKDFMLDQLRISRHDTDWSRNYHLAKAKMPIGYYHEALDRAKRDIEYHTKENAEEIERAKIRTAWVRALRKSLKQKQMSS